MTKAELIQHIYSAFKDVKLEDGIGLFEADCIDEYMSATNPIYIGWKEKDEREDWKKILPLLLSETYHERVHSGNFFFMDAKGKRFHLPCYLLYDLEEKHSGNNPLITATTSDMTKPCVFDLLNEEQKKVLIDFFEFKIEQFLEENNDFDFDQYTQTKNILVEYFQKK